MVDSTSQIVALLTENWWVGALVLVVIFLVVSNLNKKATPPPTQPDDGEQPKAKVNKQKEAPKVPVKAKVEAYSSHPLFFKSFKLGGGKQAEITAVAVAPTNTVYVGGSDHALAVYDNVFKEAVAPLQKRVVIGRESATSIAVNDTHLVVSLDDSNKCYVYKVNNGKLDHIGETEGAHKQEINSTGIGYKYFMSCSEDTEFKVWALQAGAPKAALLSTINTNQMKNHMAVVSPDSKFIAVAAFTSDVRLWEVEYNKSGEFTQVRKALELKGHKRGINYVGFNKDSTRVVTASKDGSWRLWRVNVRYSIGEDPVCELVVQTPHDSVDRIAFNPTKQIIVTNSGRTFQFWDSVSGKHIQDIPDALRAGSALLGMSWSADGKFLVTATKDTVAVWKSPV